MGRYLLSVLFPALANCGLTSGPVGDNKSPPALENSGSASSSAPASPPPGGVQLGHHRELRGVWVATVGNIDWPRRSKDSADVQKKQMIQILDQVVSANLNAIFFQVRPEADALYASSLEPWSRYLTGSQGKNPGYDPLAFVIEEGHKRGLEVHAWLNPYRAGSANVTSFSDNSVVRKSELKPYVYKYPTKGGGDLRWMDPGAPPVQAHTQAVVAEIIKKYPVDGIHFDDYFYPYPSGADFPDSAVYSKRGQGLSKADWRRQNVNTLVEKVSKTIRDTKPHVQFGISPFGVYRPGHPPSAQKTLDQYEQLFADPKLWFEKGWVDYLAPQLYWTMATQGHGYTQLAPWWWSLATSSAGRGLMFHGNYLSQVQEGKWKWEEIDKQISYAQKAKNCHGFIFFSAKGLTGLESQLKKRFPKPALPPWTGHRNTLGPTPPLKEVVVSGKQISWQYSNTKQEFQRVTIYKKNPQGWELEAIVGHGQRTFTVVTAGTYAIAAVGAFGQESFGQSIEVR